MRVRSIVNTTWPVFWEPGGLPLLEIAKVQLFSDRVAFCQKTCEVSNKLFTSYWTWGMRFHGKRCKLRCNMVQVPKRLQQVWMAGSRISQSRPQNCVRIYSVHIFMCVYIYNYVYVYIYIHTCVSLCCGICASSCLTCISMRPELLSSGFGKCAQPITVSWLQKCRPVHILGTRGPCQWELPKFSFDVAMHLWVPLSSTSSSSYTLW